MNKRDTPHNAVEPAQLVVHGVARLLPVSAVEAGGEAHECIHTCILASLLALGSVPAVYGSPPKILVWYTAIACIVPRARQIWLGLVGSLSSDSTSPSTNFGRTGFSWFLRKYSRDRSVQLGYKIEFNTR
jgi:hypothetical protein